MEHEYTLCGRIVPNPEQFKNENFVKNFKNKVTWIEQDFSNLGLKMDANDSRLFSLKSEDLDNAELEQACQSLSVILDCKVCICKDHEVYGNANVFNGGSDYDVVDEDCFLWIYQCGKCITKEQTKFWNEKFNATE